MIGSNSNSAATALKCALGYGELGLRVVPIKPGAKYPWLREWQERATTDKGEIASWFRQRPGSGVGIATGRGSGVVVLDVDPRHGGLESLAKLEALHGPLPATPKVITGGGGAHFYFAYPKGAEVRNSAGVIAPGLDIRAEGGQVVAPPTRHPDTGRLYRWEVGPHSPLAALPECLLPQRPVPEPRRPLLALPGTGTSEYRRLARYGQAAARGELEAVRDAVKGGRGKRLYRAAAALGSLVGAGVLSEDFAQEELEAAAEACGVARRRALDTIGNGLRRGKANPRELPATLRQTTGVIHQRRQPPARVALSRPPAGEVDGLWNSCVPVDDDEEIADWLKSRGLDPECVADRDLARALPPSLPTPRWAQCDGHPWGAGWRCILPACGRTGAIESLRARWVKSEPPPRGVKAAAAATGDGSATGLVLADGLGRQILRGGTAPDWWPAVEPLGVVVCEGEVDWLTWATRWGDCADTAPAVLGMWSGGWTAEIGARLPAGCKVVVRTHADTAGDKYAAQVTTSLDVRCVVARVRGVNHAA